MGRMIYVCSYDDCSLVGIDRTIGDDGELLAPDDTRRCCSGTVNVGSDAEGWMPRPCLRPLDARLDDGTLDHIEAELPDLPPPPEPVEGPPAPPPDPSVPASVAVKTAVAAAMATVAITSPGLTDAQKASIQQKVTAQVQDVINKALGL